MGFYSVVAVCVVLSVLGIAKFARNAEEKVKMLYVLSTLLLFFFCGSVVGGSEYQKQYEEQKERVKAYEQGILLIKDRVETLKEETELLKQEVIELKEENKRLKEQLHIGTTNTQYKQGSPIVFEATAYSSSETSTVTASGETARHGIVAVDPNIIPLGTSFYAEFPNRPEYNGIYYAGDTGGAIGGNIIDVFIDDYDRAMSFGRQECHVYLR